MLALAVAMVIAGFWQLDRLDERKERNAIIETRTDLPTVEVATLISVTDPPAIADDTEYRRVSLIGSYLVDDQILIRNRTLDGRPGYWVLTPFVTSAGDAYAVNRGWIATRAASDAIADPVTDPPAGEMTLEAWVRPTVVAEGLQSSDPDAGRLLSLARPDVERLGQQLDYPIAPVVLQLAIAQPEPAVDEPTILELPGLSNGPHLGYAIQWFFFSAIAIGGYPLILRRVASGRAFSLPDDDDELIVVV